VIDFEKEKWLVTCALPYVNGPIHIGHVKSTYIPADIFVRFLKLNKENVLFVCGSDTHGTPITIEAEKEGLTPKQLVSKYHNLAIKSFKDLGIDFDHYSSTDNKTNHDLTKHFFKRHLENGFVTKEIVNEYYCEKCKRFLPDRYVKGTCPHCNAKDQYSDYCESCSRTIEKWKIIDPYCAVCGSKPIARDSEHYFFKLSEFSDQLKDFLKGATIAEEVKNYVLQWLKEGLKDWDIVRDLDWGVKVPGLENKTYYVWFDAPIFYVSATIEWAKKNKKKWEEYWKSPKTKIVHFIGKDIIYHHCLFWPAMLIGTREKFSLPSIIPVRGYATLEGKKISKSRKWWILIDDFVKVFPGDYLRFYLTLTTPSKPTDGDFKWKEFQKKINSELVGNIGNFIYRTLSFIHTKFGGKVPEAGEFDDADEEFEKRIKEAAKSIGNELENIELEKALRKILEFSGFCNQYFQKKEPWRDLERAKACLYLSINAVRSLAIALEPFLPSSAEKLWNQLNLKDSVHEQKWDSLSKIEIKPRHKINRPEILFKKVEDVDIDNQLTKLR